MDYAETPTGSTPMPPLPPSGAVEAHTNFFKPLTDSSPLASNETKLPFPGFGFWPKSYAEILYDFTLKYGYVEFFNDRRSICDIVTNVDLNLGLSDVFADSNEPKCPPMWDDLSCFPATVAGQISVIPCPEEIKGVPYDTSRKCLWKRLIKIIFLSKRKRRSHWDLFISNPSASSHCLDKIYSNQILLSLWNLGLINLLFQTIESNFPRPFFSWRRALSLEKVCSNDWRTFGRGWEAKRLNYKFSNKSALQSFFSHHHHILLAAVRKVCLKTKVDPAFLGAM